MVISKYRAVVLSLMALVVGLTAGCGGGGGASGPAAANTVTGVAATGAPIAGIVYLKDSSPSPVELTTTTASDGSFAFNTAVLTPPFIIKTASGATTLYSFATEPGIANITPLTTMAMAQAAGGANLNTLYNNHVQSDINVVADKMPAAVKAVHEVLAPLMDCFGVTCNVLNGQFSANHTGMDALLDSISVSISAGRVFVTNKDNGGMVFSAPSANLVAGSVNAANIPTPPAAPSPSSGDSLYTSKCAGCHGVLANSNLKGRATLGLVQGAIGSNLGGMGLLSGLSAGDIQSIIDLLSAPASAQPGATTPPAASAGPVAAADGAALYAANCAGCHGALATSRKQGATAVRLQNAISGNVGGMGFLSKLSAAESQAIVASLNPAGSTPAPVSNTAPAPPAGTTTTPATPDGAALYAANCAGCHGALATSTKKGISIARLQNAIAGSIGGMGSLSSLNSSQQQAIVDALNPTTASPAPTPTPTPAPPTSSSPTPSPAPDGATLYSTNCAGCHGALASSTKKGITIARLQNAIANGTGGMGSLSGLTVSDVQAIVTALTPATPTPTPSTPTTPTTPTTPDGAALYASNCAGCHQALASSAKAGATTSRIQTAIANNTGGMGYLSTLTSAQVSAVAAALATVTPAPGTAPTPACGSCHAIPPSTGRHSKHMGMRNFSCATCHGSGYSSTTVNAATHNNGIINLDVATTATGWNAAKRSCSNSCHGTESW